MEGFYVLHPSKKTVKARLNRYHDRCLVFRHSHIAITNYHLGDNKEFEKCLSVWDEMAWTYRRMAGYYVSELKEFRLPRGFDLELLSRYFKGYRVVVDNDDAIHADKAEMKLTVPPKDDAQRMIITFLCNQEEFKKNSRYTGHMVDANTGLGKTYCSIAGSCFMRARTIIIVPIGKLLGQWKESYLKFTDLKEKDILIVQGSKMCQKILNGDYEGVKIFIFSLDTIISFRDHYGDMDTIEMFEKTGAYLKVFDECHLDMKGINVIEALCNTKQTIYASASPGRSQKKENWIFHRLYRHVPRFGSKFTVQDEKYLDIMIVPYRWTPTAAQINRLINRRTKWLNANLYEKELFNASREQTGEFFTKLNAMLTWSSKVVKKENKILIMCSTVEGTKTILDEAEKVFPGECARYHGGLKESEKEAALKYRVICATGQSLGTGADIKGIQHVYNVSTYGNWINANQKPGRARKLEDGTQVVYIELVNFGYMKTMRQYEKHRPELIKKTRSGQLMLIQ